MSTTSTLGKVSTFFFLAGFTCGKVQYLPFPLVGSIFNGISLISYMLGYGVWFISSHFYPEQTYNEDEWYGFAQFKEQHLFAATLGLIATVLSIAGFFVPALLIPAAWMFLASNGMWATSEYHKLKNPDPQDKDYSYTGQKAYSSYTFALAGISLVAALSTTLIFIFPPLTVPLLIASGVIIAGLSMLVAENWLSYTFDDHPPKSVSPTSHHQMIEALGPKNELEEVDSAVPYHGKNLLQTPQPHADAQLRLDDPALSDQQTCPMTP